MNADMNTWNRVERMVMTSKNWYNADHADSITESTVVRDIFKLQLGVSQQQDLSIVTKNSKVAAIRKMA